MTTAEQLARQADEFRKVIDVYLPQPSPMPTISPDYAHLQVPLMWGGIWQVPGLDTNLRSLATISAQCVNGWDFGLQHQVRVGLTLGMSPQKIKGIFIQLLFYVGIPNTVFALMQAQKVINERQEWQDADTHLEADWLDSLEDKLQRGSDIIRRNWGEDAVRQIQGSLAQQMVPEASDMVDAYNFGEAMARSDLDPKERMVCILSALMGRRHLKQLKSYVGYALNMGMNKREICEVFSQAGWYRGWPHVEDALEQAKAVFEERGV